MQKQNTILDQPDAQLPILGKARNSHLQPHMSSRQCIYTCHRDSVSTHVIVTVYLHTDSREHPYQDRLQFPELLDMHINNGERF